jgi:hypothetical protein
VNDADKLKNGAVCVDEALIRSHRFSGSLAFSAQIAAKSSRLTLSPGNEFARRIFVVTACEIIWRREAASISHPYAAVRFSIECLK